VRGGGHLHRRVRAPGVPPRPCKATAPPPPGWPSSPRASFTGLGTVLGQKLLTRISVRATVTAGFAVLTAASLGLLAITAATLADRAPAIGLVITPLLDAITHTLHPAQLADANTLFNICQRIAGALGIGLIAALFTTQARALGPVPALHATGLLLTATATAGPTRLGPFPAERVLARGAGRRPAVAKPKRVNS
jgi:hypothetical protein